MLRQDKIEYKLTIETIYERYDKIKENTLLFIRKK